MTEDNLLAFTIRIPTELLEEIHKRMKTSRRSRNMEITYMLTKFAASDLT